MATSVSMKILTKRWRDIQQNPIPNFKDVQLKDNNLYHWEGLLVIDTPPYNLGKGIKFEMIFPQNYPFAPPDVLLITPVYHMSVDENGEICVPILLSKHWKPAISVNSVIQSICEVFLMLLGCQQLSFTSMQLFIAAVNFQVLTNFQPESPVRPDLQQQFNNKPDEFYKTLQDQLAAHGVSVENGANVTTEQGSVSTDLSD